MRRTPSMRHFLLIGEMPLERWDVRGDLLLSQQRRHELNAPGASIAARPPWGQWPFCTQVAGRASTIGVVVGRTGAAVVALAVVVGRRIHSRGLRI